MRPETYTRMKSYDVTAGIVTALGICQDAGRATGVTILIPVYTAVTVEIKSLIWWLMSNPRCSYISLKMRSIIDLMHRKECGSGPEIIEIVLHQYDISPNYFIVPVISSSRHERFSAAERHRSGIFINTWPQIDGQVSVLLSQRLDGYAANPDWEFPLAARFKHVLVTGRRSDVNNYVE